MLSVKIVKNKWLCINFTLAPFLFIWASCLFAATAEPIVVSKRTDCLKPNGCSVYVVKVFEDGKVIYEGQYRVAVVGAKISQISADAIRQLKAEFDRINFMGIDTSENAIDRFDTPCTSYVEYECAKMTDERKQQAGISESCKQNSTVAISLTTHSCHLGDELTYRDGLKVKRIGPNYLKNKEVMKELSRLRGVIDQISGSTIWVLGHQLGSK